MSLLINLHRAVLSKRRRRSSTTPRHVISCLLNRKSSRFIDEAGHFRRYFSAALTNSLRRRRYAVAAVALRVARMPRSEEQCHADTPSPPPPPVPLHACTLRAFVTSTVASLISASLTSYKNYKKNREKDKRRKIFYRPYLLAS